ncbi:N-acylneuraminate cytidylyltransferase [[Eubacterium] contortum]|uniref:N-acylneuraminate cytidylyltransferase n=1 Tax=Faecalicatena contorta TaxID=39482 RepID=A0A174F8Z8_9FIRM|nr:cytidyltransferase [Faecalicatena contorta]CUO45428.1 N-acylneuraminate cytidylyltransferase [[Eubacterium] contortum] [Faecalicatena contorta]
MKILAVIPARAGSKEIPNKNIRIVGGHPLIYYSIKNALSSNYITDVIISTDSDHVRIIGEQMGALVKRREAELCEDAVTLDAVIHDAVPEGTWDYIITMQPTSPTLRVETLDAAIKYTIDSDLDTVISAINTPHLSWGERDGKKIPNYTRRLNRQYLPPCYMETGAFVISKATVVTSRTRIGEKVDVFEIPEDESQDVDNFKDLRNVAAVLDREKVAIYVNGNNKRGIGHIYRALEIADEFYSKPDIYYDMNQTDPKVFGTTTHKLIPVNGIADLFEVCKKENYTIFINDILTTSIDYMIGLRTVLPNAKLINFEDDGEGILKADLVFNALYHEGDLPQVKAGEKYYISGKTFMFYKPIEINEKVERVFISFGGADPQNYSDRLLSIVSQDEYKQYKFVVVLGRAKYNVNKLLEYNKYDNLEVLYDVSNMPELMSSCDIGVTSRGRTGYELAILGIPSISMAQNHREEKHGFVCNENGFSYIGLNPADEVIKGTLDMYLKMSQSGRMRYHEMLLSHDLRGGRKRIMSLIKSL